MSHQESPGVSAPSGLQKHRGSCHCGKVRYEAECDLSKGTQCNCTVCTKLAQLGVIIEPEAFQLLQGEDEVSSYEWGQKVGKRFFCKHCGVYCYGTGHLEYLGGAYVSINLNTLDDVDPWALPRKHFDGRHDNWMAGMRDTPWPI